MSIDPFSTRWRLGCLTDLLGDPLPLTGGNISWSPIALIGIDNAANNEEENLL